MTISKASDISSHELSIASLPRDDNSTGRIKIIKEPPKEKKS